MSDRNDIIAPVVRRIEHLSQLDADDRNALAALRVRSEVVDAGRNLICAGQEITDCCILVSGYACRSKISGDGKRQIVSFQVAGDVLDLQHLLFRRADHYVQTITPAVIAWVAAADMRALVRARPNIGEAFWRDTLIEASIFREWVLNLGQRDARSRIAHMLCEFVVRARAAGLGSPERFEVPMTQEHIADATGLTSVHVNRTLQALRAEGVIANDKRQFRIADWDRMCEVADFHPDYLHDALQPAFAE